MKQSSAASAVAQQTFLDVEAAMRGRIREVLEKLIEEEIDAALGASRHERREERRGYRHGTKPARVVVTQFGPTEVVVPRARVRTGAGEEEFRSGVLERYARRTRKARYQRCHSSSSRSARDTVIGHPVAIVRKVYHKRIV